MKQKLVLAAIIAALAGTAWAAGDPSSATEQTQQLPGTQSGTTQQYGTQSGTTQQYGQEPSQEQEQTQEQGQAQGQEQTQKQGAPLHISPAGVREVQQALKQAGHDPGAVDGIWGQQTQKAVSDFQQAQSLEPTGNLNIKTLQALGLSSLLQGQGGQSSEMQTGTESQTPSGQSESSQTQSQ